MSIALESNATNRIQRSGFVRGMSFKPAIFDSPDSVMFSGDRRPTERAKEEEEDTCSSSSIGGNSDSGSSDGEDSGEIEVQSNLKGPSFCLEALEEVLPIKRGISTFYSGKSKSFTNLADVASCSTIKDIAKPEDAYTRKRKNLLAHSYFWDKNRNFNPKGNDGGISKRLANSSRSSSNLAVMMGDSSNTICESSNSKSPSPSPCLPPLPPQGRRSKSPNESSVSPPTPRGNFSPWRSFSLSDLQHAAASTNPNTTAALVDNRHTKEGSHRHFFMAP